MTPLLHRIHRHGQQTPTAPALRDEQSALDYRQLQAELERLADTLTRQWPAARRVGLLLDNGIPWACLDLALLRCERITVPMPLFFTPRQLQHLVDDADLDLVITDQPQRAAELLPGADAQELTVASQRLAVLQRRVRTGRRLPRETIKVTYTSGTTGQPKGVCLSADTLQVVTATLCHAVGASASDRALALLPLSTLLENVAGLYAPLWSGALAQLPGLGHLGFSGSSGLDLPRLFAGLGEARPTTLVLVPQLLKALVGGIRAGLPCPRTLRFVAVGGAAVSDRLLDQAEQLGLPVYQGFGLSEAGSVVSLNRPEARRAGSVGQPLPHLDVTIDDGGEIVIRGPIFLGYLANEDAAAPRSWATGDLGHLDADGYLFITGRKKTAYATAFGRNVAPEWVEAALTAQPAIAQAAVFGAAQPYNIALLVPATTSDQLGAEIAAAVAGPTANCPTTPGSVAGRSCPVPSPAPTAWRTPTAAFAARPSRRPMPN